MLQQLSKQGCSPRAVYQAQLPQSTLQQKHKARRLQRNTPTPPLNCPNDIGTAQAFAVSGTTSAAAAAAVNAGCWLNAAFCIG
jgi:hypothetical protein